jgi:hypothetical protein
MKNLRPSSAIKGDALATRKTLEARLEAQRNSAVLSLADCCIGDEGCHIL